MSEEKPNANSGLLFAFGAYILWGFFPIYWKFLQDVDALQILAHRMAWSLAFVGAILAVRRRKWVGKLDRRTFAVYLVSGTLLSFNWWLYIWGVNSGYVVETALGYFINPLLNVLLGAAFLGERPRRVQWTAIALAAMGVIYLTFAYGQSPWISLGLGSSFAVYALLKKRAALGAIEGIAVETALMFLPAVGYLVFVHAEGGGAFGHGGLVTDGLLIFSGIATALPLLLFAAAVRRLSLTVVGVVQYLAPTIQFLLGVFLYQEAFSIERLVGFVFIWTGLALFASEGLWQRRRNRVIPVG